MRVYFAGAPGDDPVDESHLSFIVVSDTEKERKLLADLWAGQLNGITFDCGDHFYRIERHPKGGV